MSQIIFRERATPLTPASGQLSLFADTNGDLSWIDDAGVTNVVATLASNTFTGVQILPAGSVTDPSLTTTGDTNTGIYFPGADRMAFATGGVIRGSWTTDGLCFGTDTAAANALDDYEEGTWTPLAADDFSGGNTTTTGTGYYTKIGRKVIAVFNISNINTTGLTAGNTFCIQGLPFVVAVFSSRAAGSVALADIAFSGYVVPLPTGGAQSFRLVECVSGAPFADLTVSDIEDDVGDVEGTIIYLA